MFVYRIANLKYKQFTLSGIGAEKVGGRWNEKGTRAVYCSENVALALLEYYIHSENIGTLPAEIGVAKIRIPNDFQIIEPEIPKNWNQFPYAPESTSFFTKMARDRNFLGIKVPSAVVPLEYNFVLNPLYKDFGQVEIIEFLTLPIDERLKTKT